MYVKILQNYCRLATVISSKADGNLRLFWKMVGHQKARGCFSGVSAFEDLAGASQVWAMGYG